MVSWYQLVYAFVCGSMLMMSSLGLHSAAVTPSLDRWNKRFFSVFFGALVIASACFFLELAGYMVPGREALVKVSYVVQTLCATVPFLMLAVYLLHCCGEDCRRSLLVRVELAVFALYLVVVALSPFTNAFYGILPDSTMVRGPAYGLVLALLFAMLLPVLVGAVRRRHVLSRRQFHAFMACLVPVTVALSVHVFADVFVLIDATLTFSAYSAYLIIVSESVEQDTRQRLQIASQRASIAVLQMRPHFIYNTMTSIYYLCDQDPELAKQVTLDFTAYLRRNLAAMASEAPIPFAKELEHARAYLAVEKAQLEDELLVSFDTPHLGFHIPPLTLQPLVENAVKHGVDPDSGPLRIWVSAREAGSFSEVTVADDGPGFDPAVADDPHTSLANIRQRLSMMCGGTLDFEPRDGGGVVARIRVPLQE